jgi:diaminopimelate decarboxylase
MPTTNHFKYKGSKLYCEGLPIEAVAKKVATPFYLYSDSSFRDQFLSLKKVLAPLRPTICFAMKANSNLAVLKNLVKRGAGLDIVSGGELFRALKAGCPPSRIVYAGVGKTVQEIREALKANIFSFNVESEPELVMINMQAKRLKKKARVALRINPNVDAKTHRKITTGKADNKFGIDLKTAEELFKNKNSYSNLILKGLHVHIGSQITKVEPFIKAVKKVLKFIDRLDSQGIKIDSLDLGGGLGIVYHKEKPLSVKQYGAAMVSLLKKRKLKIILEPGRFISGNSGVLVTEVNFTKKGPVKNFVVVDAAMNDLMRPAIYDAYHDILPVTKRAGRRIAADVVGPICETGDVLGYGRNIPAPRPGDLLAILSAGAYGFTMANTYNSRPLIAEVMVKGRKMKVVRRADTYQDFIKNERFF